MNCYGYFTLLIKIHYQYVNPLSLEHYFDINTISPFIYVYNTNTWITTNYDKYHDNNEEEGLSVSIHQVKITNESEYQKRK